MGEKPTLLDIARRAVVEYKEATTPAELLDPLEFWWVPGAEALGLTVSVYSDDWGPDLPPEMRAWLLNEKKRSSWPRPDVSVDLPTGACWCSGQNPRELGEVMELQGRKYVLVGFVLGSPFSDFVDRAAFVPAEEVQL